MKIHDTEIQCIAVIDDNAASRDEVADMLAEVGIKPVVVSGQFQSLDDLLAAIPADADAAFCDHHLNNARFAPVLGAEVVSELNQHKRPAVLYTQAGETAVSREIRPLMKDIPGLVLEEVPEISHFAEELAAVLAELLGQPTLSRKLYQTMLDVDYVDRERGEAYVYIAGWNPRQKVLITDDLWPSPMWENLDESYSCLADVNVHASSQSHLVIRDIRPLDQGVVK